MGKSSLINGLIGSPQAKTSHKPGYTRTINFFELGKALSLVDLPGYARNSAFTWCPYFFSSLMVSVTDTALHMQALIRCPSGSRSYAAI